jgi:predicted nucleotidyltransferase
MHHNELHLSLPSRLLSDLQKLAQKYQKEGLKLFVFGSFARGNPHPTSDLDLGVEWSGKRNSGTFLRLYKEVQELPTIRPIDLVDFTQAGSRFRQIAGSDRIYLSKGEEEQRDEEGSAQKRS